MFLQALQHLLHLERHVHEQSNERSVKQSALVHSQDLSQVLLLCNFILHTPCLMHAYHSS